MQPISAKIDIGIADKTMAGSMQLSRFNVEFNETDNAFSNNSSFIVN